MLLKLVFSYDGSKFQGSQTQPHQNGVEDALAAALAHVGIFGKITSSSRTDKGVHANNQVACVECGEHFSDFVRLAQLINRHAHPFIHVKFIGRADENFHPRYDAKARQYRYVINHGAFSPFASSYQTFLPKFDPNLANELLSLYVGKHDFSAFMKLGSDVKSPVRKITQAFCYSHGEKSIIIFKANGFLRAQVRLMVASLLRALQLAQSGKFRGLDLEDQGKFESVNSDDYGKFSGANLGKKFSDQSINLDKLDGTNLKEKLNDEGKFKNANSDKFGRLNLNHRDKFDEDKTSHPSDLLTSCKADDSRKAKIYDENFLKAKGLLRQAIYEQKPLTRIPAPPNGLYLNRVFY